MKMHTIFLKCNTIFTKGLHKYPRDNANKRQMNHTSSVVEPSIPFHTLANPVPVVDIAIDKIRTHDNTLEVNLSTNLRQAQTLDTPQTEQLFTFSRDVDN